jgi:hypothetical protein
VAEAVAAAKFSFCFGSFEAGSCLQEMCTAWQQQQQQQQQNLLLVLLFHSGVSKLMFTRAVHTLTTTQLPFARRNSPCGMYLGLVAKMVLVVFM